MKGDCLVCNTTLTLSETHVKDVFSDTVSIYSQVIL